MRSIFNADNQSACSEQKKKNDQAVKYPCIAELSAEAWRLRSCIYNDTQKAELGAS